MQAIPIYKRRPGGGREVCGRTIVDDQDYDALMEYRWIRGPRRYVMTSMHPESRTTYMHRLVYLRMHGSLPEHPIVIDHINQNPRDNTRKNLRAADYSVQGANSRRRPDNTSGFKGVSWARGKEKWYACAKCRGRQYNLGYFDDKFTAAQAVNAFYRVNHPAVPLPNPTVELLRAA